MKWGF